MKRLCPLLILLAAGCSEPPERVGRALAMALSRGDADAAMRFVAPDYSDPLGGFDALGADLAMLERDFSRAQVDFEDISVIAGDSAREANIIGRLDAEWVGRTTWRVVGPVELTLERQDEYKVSTGVLPHLRDLRAVMTARRAALEANDAEALRPLLHPNYRDGTLDADEAIARLASDLAGAKVRMQATNYRVEVRGPLAHVDEHYRLRIGDEALPPSVARFTLERAAGRWRIRAGLYPDERRESAPP